jgi:hypothetical protein
MSEQFNVQYPQFKVHNRTGSVKFSLKPAYFNGETYETQIGEFRVMNRGHLMVEMANAKGKTNDCGYTLYDWEGKVSMKMSCVAIQQIQAGLQGVDCTIVHDPNKAIADGRPANLPNSRFVVSKGERFGYFMAMSRGDNKVKCPVGDNDAAILHLLLSRAQVRIYGW